MTAAQLEVAKPYQDACPACSRLPPDATERIRYPGPVAVDEWVADDRIRGALVGLAIGDGIGRLMHAGNPPPGEVSAAILATGGATQLALFTADGLLRMLVRAYEKGIGPAWDVIRHALLRWSFVRGDDRNSWFRVVNPTMWPDGWLVRRHALHARHDGFSATVAAIALEPDHDHDLAFELQDTRRLDHPPNRSDGAGALVRVAAAGFVVEPSVALMTGAVAAAYTHGGANGYLAAGALARLLAALVRGASLEMAVQDTVSELQAWPDSERIVAAVTGLPIGAAPATSVKALRVGINAARRPDADVLSAITTAAGEGGTAAAVVAGVVTGTIHGVSGLPAEWRAAPDVAAEIGEIADAVSVAHRAWVMNRDLPGWDYETEDVFEGHPACRLLWPRFPGW